MNLLAQAQVYDPPLNFWNGAPGSFDLFIKLAVAFAFGILLMIGLTKAPAQVRRPIVVTVTFLAGLFYVLYYIWPQPIAREAGQIPRGPIEGVGFWIDDAVQTVGGFSNVVSAFLLGLGVYSILRIRLRRFAKQQQDWAFSAVLLSCMLAMIVFGYWDWMMKVGAAGPALQSPINWTFAQYGRDFLFDGLLQQMDAGMFSIIAFYILSAAYRAFRVRSVEATILLATALIVMLSLMGAVEFIWNGAVTNAAGTVTLPNGQQAPDTGAFVMNFRITDIAKWLRDTVQTSSLRGIDFGVGIGALAMGLRLWLSLERGGVSN